MSKRILIATDLPFWRRSTGAQQRIAALANQMVRHGFIVRTFYLGHKTPTDGQQIETNGLSVKSYSSDQPPRSFWGRMSWGFRSVKHSLFGGKDSSPTAGPMTLNEFRWPWAIKAFSECVEEFQPTSIICEYVKMAYLLDGLPARKRADILCVIDTHDVQHLRAKQFEQRSAKHWLNIDREQETEALSRFDLVIAIQENEAELFRQMVPKPDVVVCGHASEMNSSIAQSPGKQKEEILTVGYIASANDANLHAIKHFLIEGWIPSAKRLSGCHLVIAGDVCRLLRDNSACESIIAEPTHRIELLGRVENLTDFYDRIAIIINPIQFGAGLKIKNCEALEFGKPLITTSHGIDGMPDQLQSITVVADSTAETIDWIAGWSDDRASLNSQTDLVLAKRLDPNGRKKIYERLFDLLK